MAGPDGARRGGPLQGAVLLSHGPVPLGGARRGQCVTGLCGRRWVLPGFCVTESSPIVSSASCPAPFVSPLLTLWQYACGLVAFPHRSHGGELSGVSIGLLRWLIQVPRALRIRQAMRRVGWRGCSLAGCHGNHAVAPCPLCCLSWHPLPCVLLKPGLLACDGVCVTRLGLARWLYVCQGRALVSMSHSGNVPLPRRSALWWRTVRGSGRAGRNVGRGAGGRVERRQTRPFGRRENGVKSAGAPS